MAIQKTKIAQIGLSVIIFIVLLIIPLVTQGYIVSLLASIFVAGVLASSWNIMAGFCGYVSFGHQVFFGIGAYTTAILVTSLKLGSESLWYSVLLGGFMAAAIAFALGYPALKLRGPYFSILTMGISEIFYVIMVNTPWFGGAEGQSSAGLYTTKVLLHHPYYFCRNFFFLPMVEKIKIRFCLICHSAR